MSSAGLATGGGGGAGAAGAGRHPHSRRPHLRRPHPRRPATAARPEAGTGKAVALSLATQVAALTLAILSAWLIARAWQRPPVLDLTIAVVSVRALGIVRGISRYGDRLASHAVALTAAARERVAAFTALSRSELAVTQSPEVLVDRLMDDVDEATEGVARADIPLRAAGWTCGLLCLAMLLISPWAALVLALGSLAMTAMGRRTARRRGESAVAVAAARQHRAQLIGELSEHADELRLTGNEEAAYAELAEAETRLAEARDAEDRARTLAEAAVPWVAGLSTLACVAGGLVEYSLGDRSPMWLVVIALVSFAAQEVWGIIPEAVDNRARAQAARRRVLELAGTRARELPAAAAAALGVAPAAPACELRWTAPLQWGRADRVLGRIEPGEIGPGERIVVTGPSGAGKSTLLATLAGLLPPLTGEVEGAGLYFAEDGHIFETTLTENLRLARPDASDSDLLAALVEVGLADWAAGLPEGMETILRAGDESLSGGQRRRLLLARALLSRAPIVLLDEPTEHLDSAARSLWLRRLLSKRDGESVFPVETAVVIATHELEAGQTPPGVRRIEVAGARV